MGIGTSAGEYFEDSFDLHAQQGGNINRGEIERRRDEDDLGIRRKPPVAVPGERMPEDPGGEGRDVRISQLHLIRHGSTDMNSDEKVRSWSNVPLNEEGKQESQNIAEHLKNSGIKVLFHSDLDRAADTAKDIAKTTGAELVSMPELRSWHAGDLTGKPYSEANPVMEDHAHDKPNTPLPGGESFNEFRARVFGGLGRAMDQADGREMGVVTHRGVERLVSAWHANGQPSSGEVHLPTFFDEGADTGTHQVLALHPGHSIQSFLKGALDFFTPESMKGPSEETIRDYNTKMSKNMRDQQVGKIGLPDIGQNANTMEHLAKGALEGVSLLPAGGSKALFLGAIGAERLLGKEAIESGIQKAEKLAKLGYNEGFIKEATGLERGAEGKWRYEIPDEILQGAQLKHDYAEKFLRMPDREDYENLRNAPYTTLENVLKHPDLYKAYPELRQVHVVFPDKVGVDNKGSRGLFEREYNRIQIQSGQNPEETFTTLLHEVQHWIQKKEGINPSVLEEMSPEFVDQVKGKIIREELQHHLEGIKQLTSKGEDARDLAQHVLDQAQHRTYMSQATEQEAFNTEYRLGLSAAERRATPGSATETVPRERQILSSGGFGRGDPKSYGVKPEVGEWVVDEHGNLTRSLTSGPKPEPVKPYQAETERLLANRYQRPKDPDNVLQDILRLRKEGLSFGDISKQLGITRNKAIGLASREK